LLRRLLTDPGMDRTAVLINEFGEIGLDHLLVKSVFDGAVVLQNGCICCTLRTDLREGSSASSTAVMLEYFPISIALW
jgi:G3E family GTPase